MVLRGTTTLSKRDCRRRADPQTTKDLFIRRQKGPRGKKPFMHYLGRHRLSASRAGCLRLYGIVSRMPRAVFAA
jgi:hypothetical protein